MVHTATFEVEEWIDQNIFIPGVVDLASTCAAPVTLNELAALSENSGSSSVNPIQFPGALDYGDPLGSKRLREEIAGMCGENPLQNSDALNADDVLITQGAIGANFAVLYTLISQGDHVICTYPTYQQLWSIPSALGAEVSLWKLNEANGYIPDPLELASLLQPNTKMIIINNPNNPLGIPIPKVILEQIVDFARTHNLILLSDEVYRPLYQGLFEHGTEISPCAAALGYDKVIITGSMSKAFAMAGLRIGWIASKSREIIKALESSRPYTTISVSQVDDHIASFAVSNPVRTALLERNVKIAKANLTLLAEFVEKHKGICTWSKPTAGTTAFIKFCHNGTPVDDEQLCRDLITKAGVLLVPGKKCFGNGQDFEGYVRLGYVGRTENLENGLKKLSAFLEEHFKAN